MIRHGVLFRPPLFRSLFCNKHSCVANLLSFEKLETVVAETRGKYACGLRVFRVNHFKPTEE